jgi:hypothetical protein
MQGNNKMADMINGPVGDLAVKVMGFWSAEIQRP